MKNIKITVACHKPSVLPNNPLMMPVQVGSAIAGKRMENMMHDDVGENISSQNPYYCELTAQYWTWKNVEADYYGLCHYRRFLCFREVYTKKNIRGQIEASALNAFNIERFGLEDEDEMRSIIEANDIVCGPLQDVRKLYTPRGNQPTAMRHWTAHDRALVMNSDLENMFEILAEVSPEVGKAAKEYMNGSQFLGFNCFVMKKELFDKMCEIEFAVLKKLEEKVDMTTYNQQIRRIYGFMGEIICSSFIYYIEKNKQYKVCHLPLVYFNDTDAILEYEPVTDAIPVFFDFSEELPFLFAAPLQSFLKNTEANRKYDILVAFNEIDVFAQNQFMKLCTEYKNVTLRFIKAGLWRQMLAEEHEDVYALRPYLPWILRKYSRMLVYGPKVLFAGSVAPIWDMCVDSDALISAPLDILMASRVNDIYQETEEKYLSRQLKDPLNFFYVESMIWNFDKMRKKYEVTDISKSAFNDLAQIRSVKELLNVLCAGDVQKIGQEYNVWYPTNHYLKYQLPYAPCDDYLALLKAQKNPVVIAYQFDTPWFDYCNPVSNLFWESVRNTSFYEQVLFFAENRKGVVSREDRDVLNSLFPRGKKMRGILSRLFPKGSARNKFVINILHMFHMR